MHNASDGTDLSEERSHGFGAIVSDLVALVAHVQASINLIEAAIARETSPGDQEATGFIVLDDVTPQYTEVTYALNACLGTTLQFLLDAARHRGHSVSLAAH